MTQQGKGLVCPNGHAMDDGYLHCPCCGAYRAPGSIPEGATIPEQMDVLSKSLALPHVHSVRDARAKTGKRSTDA
jgi:hypothetical protein